MTAGTAELLEALAAAWAQFAIPGVRDAHPGLSASAAPISYAVPTVVRLLQE